MNVTLKVYVALRRGEFTRSYIYDYFELKLSRHSAVRPLYDLFSFTMWLHDIVLDKIKKLLFQELYETCPRVVAQVTKAYNKSLYGFKILSCKYLFFSFKGLQ